VLTVEGLARGVRGVARVADGGSLIAAVTERGDIYLGWRLLEGDPPDVTFDVYRQTDGAPAVRINAKPLTASTNLVDTAAPKDRANLWFVRAVSGSPATSTATASLDT
jgi:hypothetical protein